MAIPQDQQQRAQLLEQGLRRYRWSKEYHREWRKRWVRYYKIWRSLLERVADIMEDEEPNDFIPYVFGMVQDLVAKATEPLFKMRPPCRPSPKKPQDGRAADAFAGWCRSYFSSSEYQLDFIAASTERIVTGNMYEKDVYANRWIDGYETARVQKETALSAVKTFANKLVNLGKPLPVKYQGYARVPKKYPVQVGYRTAFVSAFLVHPEPKVRKIKDMHWLCEEIPSVALADLEQECELDANGQPIPVYDLTELKAKMVGLNPGDVRPVDPWRGESDYYQLSLEALAGVTDQTRTENSKDDIDRVHLIHIWEPTRVFTILSCTQGNFLVRVKDHPFDAPGIPWRNRVYTIDPQHHHGIGAVEPIEDQVYLLNDIGNLAISNWIRIVNKMIAVDLTYVVDEEDLDPKAGGIIRFKGAPNGNIHQMISTIDHADVTSSMIAQMSNVKGTIEKAIGAPDLSPGVLGTKESHDTLGGIMEIQRNMAVRMSVIRRIDLACYQEQMHRMERILSQFQFDPIQYTAYGPDGSTAVAEISNDLIYTEGRGFDFLIEDDPAFGDDMMQRSLLIQAFEMALKYNASRTSPEQPEADTSIIFRKLLMNLGFADTSRVLRQPSGVLDPGKEFDILIGGGHIQVNPSEDLVGHLIEHIIQRQSPVFRQGLESGKIPVEVLKELEQHINETTAAISAVLKDPLGAAQMKLQQGMTTAAQLPPKPPAPQGQGVPGGN